MREDTIKGNRNTIRHKKDELWWVRLDGVICLVF